MANTFGEFIRKRRLELQLTQLAVAKALGFKSLAHLSDIEGGKRNPGVDTLPALARILQVTVDELEAHDPRAPIADVKQLLDQRPDLVAAFRRVVRSAHQLSSEELIARVEKSPAKPEAKADAKPETDADDLTRELPF